MANLGGRESRPMAKLARHLLLVLRNKEANVITRGGVREVDMVLEFGTCSSRSSIEVPLE